MILRNYQAAVLVLFYGEDLLLFKRTNEVLTHKNQFCFLGGHREYQDKDALATALREFHEESHLPLESIEVKRELPSLISVSGKKVIPFLAEISLKEEDFFRHLKSNGEWDMMVALPFAIFQQEKWFKNSFFRPEGGVRDFYSFLLEEKMISFCYGKENSVVEEWPLLWGMTAEIIYQLVKN